MHLITKFFAHLLRSFGESIQAWSAKLEKANYEYGTITLAMPGLFVVIGMALILLSALALYRYWPLDHPPPFGNAIALLACSVFAVPGSIILLKVRNHRMVIADENSHVTNTWGRTTSFSWNQILRVCAGSTSSAMRIDLKDGQSVKDYPFILRLSVMSDRLVDIEMGHKGFR